jgi:cobalt/nickel transport system ATP-binding protein
MTTPVFELTNVHFSYLGKFPALHDVNLTIHAGEKIAVMGANGTGKSTLLTLLDGLIFPDRGTITAFGEELTESRLNDDDTSRSFRRKVGFVFQNPDIQLFCPTVRDDIVFGPLQLGIEKATIAKRLERLADFLDIQHLLDRAPHQLSIGEKRKAAIASVLAIDPDVLILDEPTAGLDPLTTRHIVELMLDANAKGKTIITATHDVHLVSEIADRIVVFDREKKIAKSGTPTEILGDEEFLVSHNLIHVHPHVHGSITHVHSHRHA